jgi:excisionase family DNA binding protein
MDDDAPKTLSVPEAGKQLGLGKNGSYAAAARGEIPVLRFGSRLRVPVVAFERMLAEAADSRKQATT